jgi:hypothetical protein
VQIRVRRDRTGYAIQLLSMVMNRKDSPLCVSDLPLDGVATRSPGKLWAELRSAVEAWAPNCAPLRTIGVGPILADFARRERDFRTAFSRMAAVPANRLSEAEEGTSTGTYFPTQVTQGLLDAVADACEAPRERLRLRSDGSIDWRPGQSMPYGTSGARPVDGCVELQIGHFPGYPRRS